MWTHLHPDPKEISLRIYLRRAVSANSGQGAAHKHRQILSCLMFFSIWKVFIRQNEVCHIFLREKLYSEVGRIRIVQNMTMNWKVPFHSSIFPSVSDLNSSSWIPLPVFTVIFDKTRLNDASLANDTWKNHLSVHYCFFHFLSDWFRLIAVVLSFHYQIRDHVAARFV